MAETTVKAKAGKTGFAASAALPKFDIPKFDIPSVEIPAAYREIAEKSVAQAKEAYEKLKAASEEASEVLEETYTTASKGAADYGLLVIEALRSNANANFDYARDLLSVKSFSEVVELSTAHARKQFEAVTAQTKDLTALAQKVTTDSVEPIKTGFNKTFRAA
jgi:phasin